MIPYILHISILIIGFYIFYQLFLVRETFFHINRWLLIGSILLAFLIPLYEIPQEWSIRNIKPVLVTSSEVVDYTEVETSENNLVETETKPTIKKETSPKQTIVDTPNVKSENYTISIIQALWYIYLIGVGIFGINLLIQLGTLIFQILRLPSLKDDGFRIVELKKDQPPYSFLNCIFINPEKYDWDTYNQIIEHEKVHIQQGHSLDMILAELLVVFQWFNPAAWQYRKMIENNLEFLTDQSMLHQGVNQEKYQLNLLKVSVPQYPIGLVMNYNQSFLKKRIKMMNVKKSSIRSSWKYLALLPLIGFAITLLNDVQAQKVGKNTLEINHVAEQPLTEVNTAEALENASPEANDNAIVINNEEVNRNEDIAPEAKPEPAYTEPKKKSQERIQINLANAQDLDVKGFWQADIDSDEICIRFDNSNLKSGNMWMMTRCFEPSEFSKAPKNGDKNFQLTRAAGEANFTGVIEDDYGQGKYTFTPNESFKSYLRNKGLNDLDDKLLFHVFMANFDQAYFDYLDQQGIEVESSNQLKKLAIHGVDLAYLKESLPIFKQKGIRNVSTEKLVKLKIHGVSGDYIKEMTDIGFADLSLDDLIKGRIHGLIMDM